MRLLASHILQILVLYLSIRTRLIFAFVLDGSPTSHSQFRKWNAALNGTLELEFKTERPNGLVLYTDDGGTYDFFELKLVEGALRLRYNLGGGAQIITVGRELHDGHWHKVQVARQGEHTSLSVDGEQKSRTSRGKEFEFGKFETNSDVFVGGMPAWYNAKLTLLALPSVIFEPRFKGSVRNLVYSDQNGQQPRRQEMRLARDIKCTSRNCESQKQRRNVARALRGNQSDACDQHDPCQHGGICISTDSGPICECRNLEYEGAFCERDKAPSEATFRGTEFLSYDLGQTGGEPIVSKQDSINLFFRTRQPNGLLFYTGHVTDYLNLALRDGGLSVTMGLGNGKQEMHIKPSRIRFDDHQWHKVTVHRRIQEISPMTSFCRLSAIVDGVYSDHSHIAGSFTILSSSRVYVGGAVNTRALLGARVHNNFVGCLRKVEFSADTLSLNLIDLARTGSKLISVVGRLDYSCPAGDVQDPVTFTTREAHLTLPPWEAVKSGSISFKFRTKEPNGLIILNTGIRPPRTDLFAVELLNGHIYVHLDLGSGSSKIRASKRRVDDGIWHDLAVRRNQRDVRAAVDGSNVDFKTTGESSQLELDGLMYVGGAGPGHAAPPTPPSLWTAALRQGFVGCLRDLILNGKPVDLAGYARQQDSASVKPSCHHMQNAQCSANGQPCLHGGTCSEGWGRAVCNCSATSYTGTVCGRESATLSFNGSQHAALPVTADASRTQTEELVLRFRTSKPMGLLLLTSADTSPDRLELALVAGRVRANVKLGERAKNLLSGENLNDNQWHTVRFARRASNLKLQVDNLPPARAEAVMGRQGSTMDVQNLHLGGLVHAEEEIQMTSTVPALRGAVQGLVYNGRRYIELAKSLGVAEGNVMKIDTGRNTTANLAGAITARFVRSEQPVPYNVVTFRSKHTYLGLPTLKAYWDLQVDLQFRTLEPGGLLLYNAGRRGDFFALELAGGRVRAVLDLGDGPIVLESKGLNGNPLNDNRWHSVHLRRPAPNVHSLEVDDRVDLHTSSGSNINLELEGLLYVGGVMKDMYAGLPASVLSRTGFEGCVASLDIGGESPSLIEHAVVPSSLVSSGCEGPTKCSQSACANRGVCVQQWNAYACDCDMTSYTGPTCYDESIAYEFGPGRGGLVQYVYPDNKQPDTEEDDIALGFITSRPDAVLLRIDSATTQDYMELEIVEGNIFMVYNVGSHDHPLGDVGVKVNDNVYHVVRFSRRGGNATLQVDDYDVQVNSPQGQQSTLFNSMSTIQVGGKWPKDGSRARLERPFTGVIAGLSINRLRVLDLASDNANGISTRHEAQLVTGVLERNDAMQRMQQTPASGYPGLMDDLVFSGAGSGCRGDDEDECPALPEAGSGAGDDLVTPVYAPSSTSGQVGGARHRGTTPTGTGAAAGAGCDDEDCLQGSGAGEVTSQPGGGGGTDLVPAYTTTIEEDHQPSTHSQQPSSTTQEQPSSTINHSSTSGSPIMTSPKHESEPSSSGTTVSWGSTTNNQRNIHRTSEPIPTTSTLDYIHEDFIEPISTIGSHSDLDNEVELPYFPQPPPYYPTSRTPKGKKKDRIVSETSEHIATIIGIVAGALIAVILVIIIILLRYKSGNERSYKVDDEKSFQQGPLLANQPGAVQPVSYATAPTLPLNGGVRNGCELQKPVAKKRDSKDIKEWYV